MKKFLCAVLAVAMMLSMAAVSFAYEITTDDDVKLVGTFVYDADKKAMELTSKLPGALSAFPIEDNEVNTYGKPVYYLLMSNEADENGDPTGLKPVSDFKYIEKLKYKVELESGMQIIRGLSIVKKQIDVDATYNDGADTYKLPTIAAAINNSGYTMTDGYYYFAEVKLADMETTSETDVIGTLEVNRKADKKNDIVKIKDVDFEFGFEVFYKDSFINNSTGLTLDGGADNVANLKYDTNYALKFDTDEEIELEFGDASTTNEGSFTVDVSGQGKIFLKYNTDACEEIVAANPSVNMFFLNFNNAKFNRVGEFVYEMDDIVAAYKVVNHQLVPIKGAEFDTDSVTFNTRVLESYVFATAELVNPAPAATVA